MNWAMCRSRRPVPSFCSRCSVSATNVARPSSLRTYHSRNGHRYSAPMRLTGALLDRLTHHVHILSMNGERYRLTQSARRGKPAVTDVDGQSAGEAVDPDTGEITTR